MVSADESLSSAMKDGASERSLEGRGMVREEEEVGLNGCFLKGRDRAEGDARQ